MSFWNIFKKINPQKIWDDVSSGVDKLAFTKEEKAEFNRAAAKTQLEFYKSTLGESSSRSLSRRLIAVACVVVYLFLILLGVVVQPFLAGYSEFIFKVVGELTNPFLMILGFYFGTGLIRSYKSGGKQ